jgi:putative ubiquitin-RnfH superfamily antitoxin RatB of RatAB toxin-antitoxin module
MNTPYNTGKVQIGKYYQKPLIVEQDDDMIELQSWLIGDPSALRRKYWTNFTYVCVLIVMACLMVFS